MPRGKGRRGEGRHTPQRNIRVSDELWAAARERASHDGVSVTSAIVQFLRAYSARPYRDE